jgi:hypothetical protein
VLCVLCGSKLFLNAEDAGNAEGKRTQAMQLLMTIAIAATVLFASFQPQADAPKLTDAQKHQAMFDKFKALEGTWRTKSTKGWEDKSTFKTIAGGSCVMENEFEQSPDMAMVTMYYLDGETLMLTHYCVAKNAPRLKATDISDDLSTVTFTFVDGANLPTRDKGHMDKAVFTFTGPDSYTTKWTWYEKGKEQWMEEVKCERRK